MILILLLMGVFGLVCSGHAIKSFQYTKNYQWLTCGIIELLVGLFFVICAIGAGQ